jgi:small subunit ribosomal protein S1
MESVDERLETPAEGGSEAKSNNGELAYDEMVALYDKSMRHLSEGEIVSGTVINITENEVVVDVGYKSEGLIPIEEFKDYAGSLTIEVGDEVEVLLEKTEDVEGHVLLSKHKAERRKVWARIEQSYKAGEIITGRVLDRIKGGLTVDVGIRAFLPGSLVDIKPVKHLESLKGEELEFKVINMDRRRNNVVLSRKAVLEKEFAHKKAETLEKLKEGTVLNGVVKNITDYGAFVDLGGIDGLLHITDMSWGRVNHPSELFAVGDEVKVMVLKFDPRTERVSLGYKQTSEDPWMLVDKKYPLGARVRGKVVSLVDYGAFVELEQGVEGLIHVSEMSWTKKVVSPAKLLNVGDEVEAIVSELDMSQRRISLSLRQAERNPWEELAVSHPEGSVISGQVRNLTEFGAFLQITDEIDGLIHVPDMSWTKRVKHPSEVLNKGDEIQARITHIDVDNQRVSLSIKEFLPNEWESFISEYKVGHEIEGRIVNVTDFGLFVDIFDGLEGLAHVSEIDVPEGGLESHYDVGGWVRARILRIEEEDKKVGLTMRGVSQLTAAEIEELEAARGSELGAVTMGDLAGFAEAGAAAVAQPVEPPAEEEAAAEQPAVEAAEVETAAEEPALEAVEAETVGEEAAVEAAEPESEEEETPVEAVEAEAAEEEPVVEPVEAEAAEEDSAAQAVEAETAEEEAVVEAGEAEAVEEEAAVEAAEPAEEAPAESDAAEDEPPVVEAGSAAAAGETDAAEEPAVEKAGEAEAEADKD